MNILKDKTIFLLSPQPWGPMHVSKHHYAIELAKRGNKVFFVNPPNFNTNKINIEPITEHPNLFSVTYKPFFPWKLRFHFRAMFNLLMKIQVKLLKQKINEKPDIIWCFDPNSFSNLNWFKGKLNIYHPVDPITRPDQIQVAKSANIIFTVSKKILSAFDRINKPKYFINHGLSGAFSKLAKNNIGKTEIYTPNTPLKAGYAGNLLRKPIDRELFIRILQENPDIEFNLWGSYKLEQSNVSGSDDLETTNFIKKLKDSPNVVLHGVKSPTVLAREIQYMDLFFLTYKLIKNESDRSNSHKLLEYLSTGKIVLSIDIETYRDTNLILMAPPDNDLKLLELFKEVKTNIDLYNSREMMVKRIDYAMENSLEKQIEKIEYHLNSN